MSLKKAIVAASFVICASAAAPSTASADWLFTPFLGATFGGSANVGIDGEFKDEFERKLNYGASLAGIGGGGLGFEIDFGYSPNFFGVSDQSADFNLVGTGNVTTLMGNLIVASQRGAIRPYASGGIGLIRSRVEDAQEFLHASSNDFGLDAGGGIMCLSGNIGIRGDIRYFRSLRNNDLNGVDLALGDFTFWRGTVGVTFKF